MKRLKMLYEGKAKKVYTTDEADIFWIEYKDDATAFDGQKKGSILDKGAVNNRMTALLFPMLEKESIPTHFIKQINDREQLVKAVEIIPVEVIVRNIAAGSLAKRLGLEEGFPMPQTVIEFCYKSDELGDPMINEYHIAAMGYATSAQMETIKTYALKINAFLQPYFKSKDLTLVDFKIEFGLHHDQVILADEISPDTCRLWDAHTGEKLDKDRFRRDLGNVEAAYQEVLKRLENN